MQVRNRNNGSPAIRHFSIQAQDEMARMASMNKKRTKRRRADKANYNSRYDLSELVVCGECGKHYSRTVWTKSGEVNKKELRTNVHEKLIKILRK